MQSKICNYLKTVKDKPQKIFTIGEEVIHGSSDARYFKIHYKEVRTDVEVVQITPMSCDRMGYLKIDSSGHISLTDDKFNPYDSSTVFSFNENEKKLVCNTDWNMASQERFSSKCIKLGFFAVGAAAIGAALFAIPDSFDLKM